MTPPHTPDGKASHLGVSKIGPGELTQHTARDILSHFKTNGVYDDYIELDSYVVSATDILPQSNHYQPPNP